MTEIYLHIVARMADYMATHPYRHYGVDKQPMRRYLTLKFQQGSAATPAGNGVFARYGLPSCVRPIATPRQGTLNSSCTTAR